MTLKLALVFLTLSICISVDNVLEAQNFELLLKGKEDAEKDIWKKDRLNYYLDNREMNEANPESFFFRGQEKMQEGLYDNAIQDLKKAIVDERLPSSPSVGTFDGPTKRVAYLSISFCFQQLNIADSALYFCQKSIFEDYYFIDAYIQKAYLLSDLSRFADAIIFLNKAEQIFPDSKKIYFAKAQLYLQQNKIGKAKKYLAKAVKIDPDFDDANVMLATLYIRTNNVGAAMSILTKSIEKGKKPITSLYFRAMIYKAKNKFEKAYHDLNWAYYLDTITSPVLSELFMFDYYFENYERANKGALRLWNDKYMNNGVLVNWIDYGGFEYGYFFKHMNDPATAVEEKGVFNSLMHNLAHDESVLSSDKLNKYIAEYDTSVFAKRLEVLVEFNDKPVYTILTRNYSKVLDFSTDIREKYFIPDYSAQIERINQILSYDSTIINMYWAKATCFFEQRDYLEAIHSANMAIALDSTFVVSYMIRAYSNMYLKNFTASIPDFEKLIESDYAKASSLPLAYSYYKAGNYPEALKINTETLDRDTYNSVELNNQGLCYEMNNNLDSALAYYDLASKRGRSFNSPYIRSMARVLKRKGNYDEAIEILKQLDKQKYSDIMVLVDIADLYVEMNDFENAITYYTRVYKKDKSYTYAYLGAADCYLNLKQYGEALDHYDIAIESMPEYANSYYAKGLCYFDLQEYEKSGAAAYEAIQLNREFADAYKLMADSYFMLGRYSVSISMGHSAVKYDPGNKESLYKLAASILASGNIDQAAGLYQEIFDTETQVKSEAYGEALETLEYMISNDIQAKAAEMILEKVFGKSKL